MYLENDSMGSAALLWRHANYNVNPKHSYFEQCALACACLLANLSIFTFCVLSKYSNAAHVA